jgi:hypothetical protein
MPFATEELTRAFYAWEKRGRGWLQWPQTVALEPPFRPFYGHFILPREAGPDSGRRETLLSRFTETISPSPKAPRPTVPEELFAEPEPQFTREREGVVELAIALPEGTRVDHDAAESFLGALRGFRSPIAFEIFGTAERIRMQFAARESDAPHVTEAVRAFFPNAGVAETANHLLGEWRAAGERIAIAECALAREFMLPLRTSLRLDPDPLLAVFAVLSVLRKSELGVLQILFASAREDWVESVKRAVTDGEGGPFFADAPELTRLGFEKVAHPLYAVVIRLAAASPDGERASEIVDRIGAAFAHFGRADGNELVFIANEENVDLEADLIYRTTHRSGMLLSSGELVALVHPPSASVVAPKLMRRMRRTKAAPENAIGQPIVLGVNEHAGRSVEVGLSPMSACATCT